MWSPRGCRCCFPWKTITLLLVIASLALVNEDVKRSGGKGSELAGEAKPGRMSYV